MASLTLHEALAQVDEIAKELSFYDAGSYKQLQEQTVITKCRDTLEKVKNAIIAKETDGSLRADRLSSGDWRRIAALVAPLARCFTATPPLPVATSKTRHASAMAVVTLALLSSCNQKSKQIVNVALENGVVDAFVATLRNSLRNPVSDRVVKAMLYKLIEALWGFTLYATPQHQQEMVARDVVNVCIDLVTAQSVETESKLNASKTLYNCLTASNRSAVTELRTSKVNALNAQLQALAAQIPDPATAGGGGGGGGAKAISMPVMLPALMSWIWFLPHYILDHLMDTLTNTLTRLVVLTWPEGAPLTAPAPSPAAGVASSSPPPPQVVEPLQVAQLSLPNRALRNTLQNLFRSISTGFADGRLVGLLRGARLRPVAEDAAEASASPSASPQGTCLPARLVHVVREGRPDGTETKVALELLDELFACDATGEHPELADDALAAGLLAAMGELGVLDALRSEAGLAGVAAFVRLTLKLVKRAPYTPGLPARLHDSGVPASVAYLAFMPATKVSLKLEALQTLRELVQLNSDMTERVVAMNNFPVALTNTLLGGDPDVARRASTKTTVKKGGGSKKKGGAAAATAASSAAAAAAAADGSVGPSPGSSGRNYRDQMQEAAFDILTVVLDVARENNKVWETVVVSGMVARLVQHAAAFPMQPSLLAEVLLTLGINLKDQRERDTASVGAVQAACAPHLLPLLLHEDPLVAGAAARVLKDILLDMARYRADAVDVVEGDDILRAVVAAGAAIDNADAAMTARLATWRGVAAGEGTGAAAGAAAGPRVVKVEPGTVGGGGRPGPAMAAEATAMDVDVPSASAAAPDGNSAGDNANGSSARRSGGGAAAAPDAVAAVTTPASPPEAPEPEVPELVDVTAHGLGLICAAMQSCVATVLQRPRAASSPASSPAAAAAALAAAPAGSTASSPPPLRGGDGVSGSTSTSAGPATIVLDGPAYESLCELLLSCKVLGEACLQMPTHGSVRRHLARALAYAKPAGEELAAALAALSEPEEAHLHLLSDTREVLEVLDRIPVLDTALLPKPKSEEDEEARDAGPAPAANGIGKKGRPLGSNKRSSQANLAAEGGPGGPQQQQQQQPGAQQPSNKRQRTAPTAAAAAAAATTVAAAASADDAVAAVGTPGRTRSANLASVNAENAPQATTGSPRIAALRAAAAAAAAGSAAPRQATEPAVAAPTTAAQTGPTASRNGADAAAARRAAPEGLPPLLLFSGRGRPPAATTTTTATTTATTTTTTAEAAAGLITSGSGAIAGPGSEVLSGGGGAGGGGATIALPAMPPAGVDAGVLGILAPTGLHMLKAPPPSHPTAAAMSSRPGSLVESPSESPSLDKRSNSLPASATAAAAATAAASTGDGGGGGAAKGRLSAAEFRSRYLDLKDQVARMAAELEEQRAAREAAEETQRRTADQLAARTQEVAQMQKELERRDGVLALSADKVASLRVELAEARAELAVVREVAAEAQAAVSSASAGLRELEALRAENAELRAELASLADLD